MASRRRALPPETLAEIHKAAQRGACELEAFARGEGEAPGFKGKTMPTDPEARSTGWKREEAKAARELAVFLDFARFAEVRGLHVRPSSAVSRPAPEPDILCEVEGEGPVAYELVEIVDPTLAENISVAVRKKRPADGAWVGDTTLERMIAKLEKAATYVTPRPIELVAWANPMFTPPDVWLPSFEERLRAMHRRSRFRRIWVVNLVGPDDERGVWFVDPLVVANT